MSIYQESGEGTFTHNGQKYNLNKIFEIIHDKEITQVKVSDLKWILKYTQTVDGNGNMQCTSCKHGLPNWHAQRVNDCDVNTPIIIIKDNGKLVTLDGVHRLEKAINMHLDTLPSKYVTNEELEIAKI